MRNSFAIGFLAAMAVAASGQQAAGTASVSGHVLDGSKKPLAGITVMLTRAALKAGEANPGTFLATSDSDGAYTVPLVEPGEYYVCASDDAGQYVNPCVWSDPQRIAVAADKDASGLDVQLDEGAELDIDVNDPGQKLSAVGPQGQPNRLLIGVAAPRLFLPATPAADTPGAKHFTVLVPYDTDVKVTVASPTLSLGDANGNKLGNGGGSIGVKIPKGHHKGNTVTVTVTGVESGMNP
jgi:hypothetical protein